MEAAKLRKFIQFTRRISITQVTAILNLLLAKENPARRECLQVIEKLEEAFTGQSEE